MGITNANAGTRIDEIDVAPIVETDILGPSTEGSFHASSRRCSTADLKVGEAAEEEDMSKPDSSMRAVTVHAWGGADAARVEDRPIPAPTPARSRWPSWRAA